MKHSVYSKILLILLVVSLASCSARKYMQKANASYEIGEYYRAIEKYRRAYRSPKLASEKGMMAFHVAESYYGLSDFPKAAVWYKNAIKRNYSDPLCMLHYADCLKATVKYGEAVTWYQTYLGVKPDDQKAKNAFESCILAKEWLDKPNRYIVTLVRELNSKDNDYCPAYASGRDNEIIFSSPYRDW